MKIIKLSFLCFLTCFFLSHQTVYAQVGVTWTSQTSAADNEWFGVTYGNGLFVAVAVSGFTNRVMTSSDGITWTSRTSAVDNPWYSVTYGNGLFVAVSDGGGSNGDVMTSPDGINWTSRTGAADKGWGSVTYGNGLFVAVAYGAVMTSPDGITWTSRIAAANLSWQSITYGNGLFVAVASSGSGNRIMTSPDGITWTSRISTDDLQWHGITYGNNLFVTVGNGTVVMTSPDGITWTNHVAAANAAGRSITYGNGLFVAVGLNSISTSPDGITWTSRTSPVDNEWRSVTYGNGVFVAVSNNGINNRVMTSGTLGVLAVNWLNINGTLSSTSNAQLTWKVAEENVKNYSIEKSNDGTNYSAITTITSRGNGENSYMFTETAKLFTDAWYRIKQTDNDGKTNYSSTVFISANSLNKIKVYPNPAHESITVNVSNALLNKTARLTNMDGKLLQTLRITSPTITLNLQGYSTGVYLLKVEKESPIKINKQ